MPIRVFQVFKWLTLLLFMLLLSWGAYYIYHKGFGRHWRVLLSKEFQRFGLEIRVRRLTLDPFRGLVANDLEIYDSDRRQTVLAQVSDLSLDINYANLFQQEPALNAVDLRDAKISIPLDPKYPKAGRIRLTGLQSRIYFFPGRIEVRQASGVIFGIHLQASGTLVNPAAFRFLPAPEPGTGPNAEPPETFLRLLVKEIESLHFSREAPELDFTFQIDLANISSLRLQGGRLVAEAFTRQNYQLRDLDCQFRLENQRFDLQKLFVQDAHGEFFATGNWNLATGEKIFQLRSGLNLAELLANDPRFPWAKEITFGAPPEIELSGVARPDGHLQFLGRLNFDRFSVRNVQFQSMKAEFSRSEDSWMISDAQVTHRSGTLSGDVLHLPGDFRMRVNSALNPTELMPLFPPRVQRSLAGWEFQTSPVIQATVSGPTHEFDKLSGGGQVWLGKTKFRGALLNSASASFLLQKKAIRYDQVRVIRDEGIGTGEFTYDLGRDEVTLEHVEANLYPGIVAGWIDPSLGKIAQSFDFGAPPMIHAGGILQFENGSTNDLRVQIDAPNGFKYHFDNWKISFDSGAIELSILPDHIDVRRFVGRIGEGRWSMESQIRLPFSSNRFRSSVHLEKIDVQRLTEKIRPLRDYQGQVDGDIEMEVDGGEPGNLSAHGSVSVPQAKLGGSKLFAPLLTRLEPLGLREPLDLKLRFRLDPDRLKLSSLQLVSGPHALSLSGSMFFLGGIFYLAGDFDGGALPVHGMGTIREPLWKLSSPAPR